MGRLVLHIIVETLFAIALFLVGAWLFEDHAVTAVAFIVVGFLVMSHLILAAAFGRLGTPFDFGAGHRVPGDGASPATGGARKTAGIAEH